MRCDNVYGLPIELDTILSDSYFRESGGTDRVSHQPHTVTRPELPG